MNFGEGIGDLVALKDLLSPDDDESNDHSYQNQYQFGSVLNPTSMHGKEKKEMAPPNTKIEVKVFDKQNQDASNTKTQAFKDEKSKAKNKNDIWDDEEVEQQQYKIVEDRPQPEFEVLYKHKVGTEDVFLNKHNMGTEDLFLLIKIKLPGTQYSEVELDVKEQSIHVQTSKYALNHVLQYPVDKDKGKAQWEADKFLLSVTLPVISKSIFDEV